ncbi:hypothetical protein [Actibacterium sp. 188UL27-1]|uniref:hypothetical protein n=1 Tax=Actibacterium sp. 188UL27-1 TaxID=2786961 RepID=UPI0019588BCF|nr:hypothetical protein [Actibacterium sp. 188UL27-1]MBM7068694.1 hypothetical protein [Actibacterium sp. 188UL27-1]
MTPQAVLRIDGLNLSVGGKSLFEGLSFAIRPTGMTAVMGPVGTGKSSLLKWCAAPIDGGPYDAAVMAAEYAGAPLAVANAPGFVPQNAIRTLTDGVHHLAKMEEADPALICVDEPTAHLAPDEAAHILRRLADMARERSIVLVSHNQSHVASFADRVLLLAGGTLQEDSPAQRFFVSPSSDAGRQFIQTGGATLAPVGAPRNALRSDLRRTPDGLRINAGADDQSGGVRWAIDDTLGLYRVDDGECLSKGELQDLAATGVSGVIMIDAETPPNLEHCAEIGILGIWIPMQKTATPSTNDSTLICAECRRLLDAKQRIVVIGDRSTQRAECLIAAQMVHFGVPADRAAGFAQTLVGDAPLRMETEQLLWDLELAQDLAEEGISRKQRRGKRPTRRQGTAKGAIATF